MSTSHTDRLIFSHVFPPIPDRSHDWSCHDDSYDASWEGEEDGWVSSSIVGWGPTKEAALADYLEQLSDEERSHAD